MKENNIIATNVIEDTHNLKFGSTGRHVSPDENGIFKTDKQMGSVEICSNGWGTANKITPEECEQRIEENTTDIEVIKKRHRTDRNWNWWVETTHFKKVELIYT